MISRENMMREALSELEAVRAQNRESDKARRAEASERSPLVASLIRQRESLFFSGMRDAFADRARARDISVSMGDEVKRINARLREALAACGLPQDYLQPIYRCPVCQDTGYVGEPVHEPCACLKRAVMQRLYRSEGLQRLEQENFETFDEGIFPDAPLEGFKGSQRFYINKIRERCERFADGFDPSAGEGLVLCGKPGLGKTFLMNCVAQRVLERGYSVMIVSAYRLVEIMRRYLFEEAEAGQVEDMLSCDLLCIDDLGSEPMMRNTVSALYHIVSERHNARRGIVITTNCSLKELDERYDARVTARLCDQRRVQIIEFVGSDVRIAPASR